MLQIEKPDSWSTTIFSNADLGDKRRTKRLISIGSQLSTNIGGSLVKSCEGDEGKLEGIYRFLRNAKVKPEKIAESGFLATVSQANKYETLLALEDTTTLGYTHSLKNYLGDIGGNTKSTKRGYLVHNVLMLDAKNEQTVGLIEQNYWLRASDSDGRAKKRKARDYEEKESFKWEEASQRVATRMGEKMTDVISVCDREADVYEYLHYKHCAQHRYIVRASYNRKLKSGHFIFDQADTAPILGYYDIKIPQKGGRAARNTILELSAMTVKILAPTRKVTYGEELTVNLVIAKEKHAPDGEGLCWMLLTEEPIDNFDQARQITRYYELRWRVEDFHKAWKSGGTGVEALRLQTKDNLKRTAIIMAFVAVRLLQMREIFSQAREKPDKSTPCDKLLDKEEWQTLWVTREKKALPDRVPSAVWAYKSIAKLGGWTDSKRTGVVGWKTLWDGWFRLQDKVDGMLAAKALLESEN